MNKTTSLTGYKPVVLGKIYLKLRYRKSRPIRKEYGKSKDIYFFFISF